MAMNQSECTGLSRAYRRAIDKAVKRSKRHVQKYRDARGIIKERGFRGFEWAVPITEEEHTKVDLYVMELCCQLEAWKDIDPDVWQSCMGVLLEGWALSKLTENHSEITQNVVLAGENLFRLKTMYDQCKPADADMLMHFRGCAETVIDMRKLFNRDELAQCARYLHEHTKEACLQCFGHELELDDEPRTAK